MNNTIKLSNDELRLMQLNELELLVEVDRICRKNNIKYSLDGGTLLGAIRHKGFIPWDDDADVVFTRKEYEKFYEACKRDLNQERYFFQDYRTDSQYRWGYGKLRHLKTEFIRSGQEHMMYRTGVCIDLFPDDNIPDGWLARRMNYVKFYLIRKALYSELGMIEAPNFLLRLGYKIIHNIPRDYLFKIVEKEIQKHSNEKTEMICHLLFPTPGLHNKYGIKSSFLNEYEEKEFEGMMFYVTKQWDAYLKCLYNDYTVLPPIEKRTGPAYPSKLELSQTTLEEIQIRYNNDNNKYRQL